MKLSAPTKLVWIIATILGILGIVGHFASVPFASPNSWWLVVGGFVLLELGTLIKGI